MWAVLVLWWALPPCRTMTKDVVSVSGVVGHQAELPCNLTPPTPDDGVYLVLWYKDEVAHPIYSIDSRTGGLHVGKHVIADAYTKRSTFVTDSRPARLIISDVTTEDEGQYRCRVDFKVAKTRNQIIILKLIIPPSKPMITKQFGEIVDDEVGPYVEGTRLILICDTDGGDPPPQLSWWLGSDQLDDEYDMMSGELTRNKLVIPSLDRTHSSALLSCQATNNNLTLPVISTVRLSLYLRPTQVTILDDDRPMIANTPDKRRCLAEGSNPPASISWWLDENRMTHTEERVSVNGNSTFSTVTLVLSGEDNGKVLTCRAENPQIQTSAIEDRRRLDILFSPELVIRLGNNLRPDKIREEHDVYFDCEIRANPWVSDVTWFFEGHELQTNTTAGIIVTNQTLVLQRVRRGNRGRYACSAVNSQGRGESRPLTLRIQYAPSCKESQKSLYGVTKHRMARITCDVEADPHDVVFQWSFNQSREDVSFITFDDHGQQSVATYVPRSDNDYGTLACWAANDVGTQLEPCVFFVVPAGPPDPLHNCTVKNETGHSFIVRCFVENRSGLTERYHLEVWDEALQKMVSNESDEQPMFVVKDLPPGRSFTLTAYVSNELGISTRVVLSGVKLAMSDRLTHKGDHWQSRMMPFIAILISLMVGLLLLAAFVVALVKIKKSVLKKKVSQHGTENSIPNNVMVDTVVHVPVYSERSWRGFLNIAALWRRRKRGSNSQVPQVSLENSSCHNSFYDVQNHRSCKTTGSLQSSTSSVHQTAL